jgi:acyl carrier protein
MTQQEFLREIDALMEADPGTLKGGEVLASIPEWDSMRVLSFIVLVEEQLHVVINGSSVAKAKTVNDLLGLVAGHLHD